MSGHRARKRFGQHFLTDDAIIDDIVASLALQPDDTVVEIGPGRGALTRPLASRGAALHAIEFDRDLVGSLVEEFSAAENVTVHEADALDFDFSTLGNDLRVVGNLPYNISTPILFHLLNFISAIRDITVMLQKEVVDRMVAEPGSKAYGRLTVMLQSRMEVVPLLDVPPEAFSPPPRVDSAVVCMRPVPTDRYAPFNPDQLSSIVASAFSKRRKTIQNALKGRVAIRELEAAGIDPGSRPEQVGITEWIALANTNFSDQM